MTWLLIIAIHFPDHIAKAAVPMADKAACERAAESLSKHRLIEAMCVPQGGNAPVPPAAD